MSYGYSLDNEGLNRELGFLWVLFVWIVLLALFDHLPAGIR